MTHPAPARHAVRPAALWFGLFAAPLFWSVQELVSYTVIAHACYPQDVSRTVPALPSAAAIAVVVGAVAFGVAIAAGLTAFRVWRATHAEYEEGDGNGRLFNTGEGRTRFMAFAGLLLSLVFLLAIALNLGAIFLLPTCL